jgi:hypothetical protein
MCKEEVNSSRGILRQAEVALGVPGRLSPQIFSTFGITRVIGRQVVGRQPNAPAAFTPGQKIPGSHFQRLSRRQGTWFCRKEPQKKSQVTPPGIDPETVRLVVQSLNHYASKEKGNCKIISDMKIKTYKRNSASKIHHW